jgi:hypothetical protein
VSPSNKIDGTLTAGFSLTGEATAGSIGGWVLTGGLGTAVFAVLEGDFFGAGVTAEVTGVLGAAVAADTGAGAGVGAGMGGLASVDLGEISGPVFVLAVGGVLGTGTGAGAGAGAGLEVVFVSVFRAGMGDSVLAASVGGGVTAAVLGVETVGGGTGFAGETLAVVFPGELGFLCFISNHVKEGSRTQSPAFNMAKVWGLRNIKYRKITVKNRFPFPHLTSSRGGLFFLSGQN